VGPPDTCRRSGRLLGRPEPARGCQSLRHGGRRAQEDAARGEHEADDALDELEVVRLLERVQPLDQVIHQSGQFWDGKSEKSVANIAASFQRAAIDILVDRVLAAAEDTGCRRIVAGGGVAANSYLRQRMASEQGLEVIFPSLKLCTDNAAMVAGLGYHSFMEGNVSDFSLNAEARVPMFKRAYP